MPKRKKASRTLTRRAMLKRGAALSGAVAGSSVVTGFPMVWAQNIKNVTLRQFGTGVSNINAIAEKAKEDLGITLQMTALDTDSTAQRVVTQPKASTSPTSSTSPSRRSGGRAISSRWTSRG